MSQALDPTLRELDDCGCCEGQEVQTPRRIWNRPGLALISRRAGDHALFKEAMLARLSSARHPALSELTTRDDDDLSIALLDAWATVADVLTFYQERIANESYLPTATERLSLLHLARLIGYELRPGVAAQAYLAFTIDSLPGSPGYVTIDAGAQVQSTPGPDEKPQIFETAEELEARAAWNAMRPRQTQDQTLTDGSSELLLQGVATLLKPGDGLLYTPEGGEPVFRLVAQLTVEPEQNRTRVALQPEKWKPASDGGGWPELGGAIVAKPGAWAEELMAGSLYPAGKLTAIAAEKGFVVGEILANLGKVRPGPEQVLAFRTRAAIFGHNAPDYYYGAELSDADPPQPSGSGKWMSTGVGQLGHTSTIHLDNLYPRVVSESWVVLKSGAMATLHKVSGAAEVSICQYSLSGRVTQLALDSNVTADFEVRKTTVFAESEALELAPEPILDAVSDNTIDLDGWVEGLTKGKMILVCGELSENLGNSACELAVIDQVIENVAYGGYTKITLQRELAHSYVRSTVTIYGNVVRATHGQSVQEVLGSGDGAQAHQRFTLRQAPLTYVGADTPSGAESTLQVRVNQVLWHEVPFLFGHGPHERVFVTRRDDAGITTVQFGDGQTGARLPSGQENVRAIYRKGIGLGGLLKAGQLNMLMTRPLGVRGVTNPLPSEGADDPESRDDARRNAPLTVLTLDRVVSLRDYEDFARAFAGVAKALATWVWDGDRRGVLVTVAGPGGAEIPEGGGVHGRLLSELRKNGDPRVPLRVRSYRKRLFGLTARLWLDPDYLPERVLAAIRQALEARLSFDARSFGQGVTLSEVTAAVQAIPGVVALVVDRLYRHGEPQIRNEYLSAALPAPGVEGEVDAAELLTLHPEYLELNVMED